MKLTEEQIQKMNAVKTVEELIDLAKAEGVEASEEEIKAKFEQMHKEGELSDDELNNVAGGCGADIRPEDVTMAQAADGTTICPYCKGSLNCYTTGVDDSLAYYDRVCCVNCNAQFRHYWEGNTWTKG